MLAPPENTNGALQGAAAEKRIRDVEIRPLLDSNGKAANQALIATIATGHSSQVRVHLRRWRDQTKVEIKHFTATVPNVYMASGAGISLDIEKLPELLKAIVAVEHEAITRGLLSNGRAAK
jgi:hypothetical protein